MRVILNAAINAHLKFRLIIKVTSSTIPQFTRQTPLNIRDLSLWRSTSETPSHVGSFGLRVIRNSRPTSARDDEAPPHPQKRPHQVPGRMLQLQEEEGQVR